ncbi:MAG: hypothetical protein BWY74_02972 [Firmicutes bacterium ADurb.Bin419]|nr:MAG: hypothetical protein BWY74_02972 [Firmicutes bacterium ADurb.Bin419]
MKVFKKMVIMTMILVLCTMVLEGCGNKVESPGNTLTDTPNNTSVETQTGMPTDSSTDASEKVIKEGNIEKNGNVILKQLAFVYRENTIALSDIADDQKIESMLGKPDEIKSHTYSNDDGKNMDPLIGRTEKQYHFPGLIIKTIDVAEDKKSFIFSIEITDPKYPTVRNIKVGDSFERLKEAYPEGILLGGELTDEEDDFRYEPVNYVDVMNFRIKNKKIESILIYTLLD